MKTIYLADWSNDDWSTLKELPALMQDFEIKKEELVGVKILLAYYSYEDYSGEAFVLFEKEGKLHEVNGSHCSCYGLEGQWCPEETSVIALLHRAIEGRLGSDYYGNNCFKDELLGILKKLKKKGFK